MANLIAMKNNIVDQIITGFGAEDEADNVQFKEGINAALNQHLDPYAKSLNDQIVALQAQVTPMAAPVFAQATPKKKGGNGYNLFGSEMRANLAKELGSEEVAKEEFKKRGGITGIWVREAWHKLTDEQKKVYNERAKAGREAAVAPQMMMTPQGAVPIQMATPKRQKTKWQLFQGAWSRELKEKKASGEAVPTFATIGERTKACSAAYKLIKDTPQLDTYLQMHC